MANMDDEARRKKRRCLLYIIAGVILQTAIIVLFVLIFMRSRNPKVRLGSVTLGNLKSNSTKASTYFRMSLDIQVTIKNPNFGHYKFDKTTLTISYRGTPVGTATIPKTKVRYRSTKEIKVKVSVSSRAVKQPLYLQMRRDIKKGVLTLNGNAKLSGKVHLFEVFKKKKSAGMDCSVDVNVGKNAIQSWHCK